MTHKVNFFNQTGKKSKYGNQSQNYNGVWYHSKKEAKYAEDLDWRVKSGEIIKWERQVKLDLRYNGKHITNYFIDFKEYHANGDIIYTEVKGFQTQEWRLKWKITESLWPNIEGVEENAELLIVR